VRFVEKIWSGDSTTDKIGRSVLSPLSLAFRGVVALRGQLYESGLFLVQRSPIPVLSVGNITVGGTGKTPIAAWFTSRLVQQGLKPAVVLRGYGGDESLVHKILNPSSAVITSKDRASGIIEAWKSGADVVVLDDAFQHRRASRDVDVVLVSADDWTGEQRLLPAGPYREPLESLSRASLVIITRKAAGDIKVTEVEMAIQHAAPATAVAVASLNLDEIVPWGESSRRSDLRMLQDKSVLAVAAIGNPEAFFAQLFARGARVTPEIFPDHHAFTSDEITTIAGRSRDFDYTVCTLKDAVKLGPRWPADARPLWYVSLSVIVERGEASIDEIITRLRSSTDLY
jgi:tetraacyldisaccharide 4'-kinase